MQAFLLNKYIFDKNIDKKFLMDYQYHNFSKHAMVSKNALLIRQETHGF